ncbi:MAG: hypothetical protein KIT69_12295, partial [Propionibacteriaceae bacterium]|nr:hypothetical protein [Propionibacteriaceae bacterium]
RATTVGHDLTSGCATFYRLTRTPSGVVAEPDEAAGPTAEDGVYQTDGEESGSIDIDTLAAIAAEEFEAGVLAEDPEVALARG